MKDKIFAIIIFIMGFISTFNINFGTYKEYNTHKNIEFVVKNKIEKAPAYKYSGELGFICINKNDNKQYYIPVNEITYYNNDVGDIVVFKLSQYNLDYYSGNRGDIIDTFKNVLFTLLFIISFTITIVSLIGFKDSLSKFEKFICIFTLIYLILSVINIFYINILC